MRPPAGLTKRSSAEKRVLLPAPDAPTSGHGPARRQLEGEPAQRLHLAVLDAEVLEAEGAAERRSILTSVLGDARSSSSNTRSAAPTPATTWVSVEESVLSGPYISRTAPT